MLRFRSLASSSAGNATLVEASDGSRRTRVLIDCGLGWRQLRGRLDQAGLTPEQLDAIFITHEHGDHVGCAPTVSARYNIPLWTALGTAEAIAGKKDMPEICRAADGQTITIGALQITPFTVPHDAREPLQLTCTDGDRTLGVLTDLGHCTPYVLSHLEHCHALILESNHDPELLARSRYPDFLKRRIAGALGHLNNAQAGQILQKIRHGRLNTVIAAHLSEQNNQPALVRRMFSQALGCGENDVIVATPQGLDWLSA